MAVRKPLVLIDSVITQLPAGDSLDLADHNNLIALYGGALGGSAIKHAAGAGTAFHADAQALLPALTTAIAAAPRDPVFAPTGWAELGVAPGSPVGAAGTSAGAQLVAGAGGFVQLTTGSTAAGQALMRYLQAAELTHPAVNVSAVRLTAEVLIPTLSTSAQRFTAAVAAYLHSVLQLAVGYTDNANGGAFTLYWEVVDSESSSESGSLSTGVVPSAGVSYEIDIDASFSSADGEVTVRVTNLSTGVVTSVTQALPPIIYDVDAPPYWDVSIFKAAGTTARTVRFGRARGYVLLGSGAG